MIQTKTLKFWGLKTHPFKDQVLRDSNLDLFVGRSIQLATAEDALAHSRLIGIHGGLGVGKSSFLYRFQQALAEEDIPVGYLKLTADSESTLYRELVTEALVLLKAGTISVKSNAKLKPDAERHRLQASITESRGSNFSGKIAGLLGGDLRENTSSKVDPHDEDSARLTLARIIQYLKGNLVFVISQSTGIRRLMITNSVSSWATKSQHPGSPTIP
ncbi:MAG: hypothetical protein AAF191_14675 [Verrucomicrobiota bacterium]